MFPGHCCSHATPGCGFEPSIAHRGNITTWRFAGKSPASDATAVNHCLSLAIWCVCGTHSSHRSRQTVRGSNPAIRTQRPQGRGRAADRSVRRERAVAMVAGPRGATSHIRVWAPCPSKRKLKAWRDAGAKLRGPAADLFRFEAGFSQEQVEALPPPAERASLGTPIAEVQGSSLAWARERLEALAAELGYSVTYCTVPKGRGGSCDPKTNVLTISDDASVKAQADVTCHALVRVDRPGRRPAVGLRSGGTRRGVRRAHRRFVCRTGLQRVRCPVPDQLGGVRSP